VGEESNQLFVDFGLATRFVHFLSDVVLFGPRSRRRGEGSAQRGVQCGGMKSTVWLAGQRKLRAPCSAFGLK